jgi:tryptophan synthase alpha chain
MNQALPQLFAKCKSENRAALIGYLPAGFPNQRSAKKIIKSMISGGVDAVEIGYPYSDPVMDGPVIQAASEQSLENGTGAEDVFELLAHSAQLGAPSLVMSYWSPIEKYGVAKFAAAITTSGGCGVITPDLTIEESGSWRDESAKNGIDRVYVVAPSSSDARLKLVSAQCSGFVYAASLMGVTGTRESVSGNASGLVAKLRATTQLPIAVGLGVSTKEQAREVATYADGVIVGSAFIKIIQQYGGGRKGLKKVKELAQSLSEGVRSAKSIK